MRVLLALFGVLFVIAASQPAWLSAQEAVPQVPDKPAPATTLPASLLPAASEPGAVPAATDKPSSTSHDLRESATRALVVIERSSAEYLKQRECFSCHHQAMSILTLIDARQRGLVVDHANLTRQVQRTVEHLQRGQADYAKGKGQGGGVDTAGYALLGLATAGVPQSATTEAVVEYLLQIHASKKRWVCSSNRPPTEANDITTSALALRGLNNYAPAGVQTRVDQRLSECRQWLTEQTPIDTEQYVFKILALQTLIAAHTKSSTNEADNPTPATKNSVVDSVKDSAQTIEQALITLRGELLARQCADGGWAQTEEMTSDAYATGTALYALAQAGLKVVDPAYQRGLQYLLSSQQADGSWHVATRSKPIQKYFESGFPHGVDQFISMSATCWATLALLQPLPKEPATIQALPKFPWQLATDQVAATLPAAVPDVVKAEPTAEQLEFFEREIRPLLVENCASCHGADKQSGGLRVDSLFALLSGGDSGPALIPRAPERSLMIKAVRRDDELKMPPDDPLSAGKVAKLQQWIEMGAPWPKAEKQATFDKRRQAAETHWAFQVPVQPAPSQVRNSQWPASYIDNYVLAQLEKHDLLPNRTADRRDLLRRLTYDLIGLPPSFQEQEELASDLRPDAIDRRVDRLLASPKFGQQWGRHWLDIARYSDTKGYVYAREERFFVNAPAYRDWVINALANDMPYDRFVKLQVAADQIAPDDPASQAAMGFLTIGRRFLGVTHDIVDDRIDVVTRGLLGLTVGCARCHDHKFDPIPTADYYSLYGVFNNSIERRVEIPSSWSGVSQVPTAGMDEFRTELAKRVQKYQYQLAAEKQKANERVLSRLTDYLLAQLELNRYPAEGFDVLIGKEDLVPAQIRRIQAWLLAAEARQEPIFAAWRKYQALRTDSFKQQAEEVTSQLAGLNADQLNPWVAKKFMTPPESMQQVAQRYGELLGSIKDLASSDAREGKALAELKEFLTAPSSPFRVPDEDIATTEQFFETRICETLWKLQGEIDRWIIQSPAAPQFAIQMIDRPYIREPHVFRRGNPLLVADRVPRQFLSVLCAPAASVPTSSTQSKLESNEGVSGASRLVSLNSSNSEQLSRMPRVPFQHGSGRRELAEAIVDPRNPMTARVWVNRLWQHLFGQGLVSTPSDFGLRANPPSHPEILDMLARDLIDEGYSTKRIVRQMVLSNTYRQSTQAPQPEDQARFAKAVEIDPDNRWLWKANTHRLSFEQQRDTWLTIAGEIDHTFGGRARTLFGDGTNRRRTIYGLVDRQFLPGVLRVFDFANPDLHTPARSETTVPQQALFELNHEFTAQVARRIADDVERETAEQAASLDSKQAQTLRVQTMFRRVLARAATTDELNDALTFVDQSADLVPKLSTHSPAWKYGFGQLNTSDGKLDGFTALPWFNGSAWQGGEKWPDGKLGWVQITATGGHAGNDLEHAAVRRWVAPHTGKFNIKSTVIHNSPAGDGIRAAVVLASSPTSRLLKNEVVHNGQSDFNFEGLDLVAGDTLDFVVNFNANLNNDQFLWSPVITQVSALTTKEPAPAWRAEQDFSGPQPKYLNAWQQLAQVLLLSNEVTFVD